MLHPCRKPVDTSFQQQQIIPSSKSNPPSSTRPGEHVQCGCVEQSLVSVYSGRESDQLACDV